MPRCARQKRLKQNPNWGGKTFEYFSDFVAQCPEGTILVSMDIVERMHEFGYSPMGSGSVTGNAFEFGNSHVVIGRTNLPPKCVQIGEQKYNMPTLAGGFFSF